MKTKNFSFENNKFIPIAEELLEMEIPLLGKVMAGFPSEAFNYTEEGIDFNKLLVKQKETTFCLVAGGDSMAGDGIFAGDLLVVDKLEEPRDNSIVVFSIDGEFTLKRLKISKNKVELIASNPQMPTITLHEGETLQRWGVLKYVIKKF